MSKSQSALANVQDLYLIQVELWQFLDAPAGQVTPEAVAEAKKNLRTFSVLLKHADEQYMGGEDVVETLRTMRAEVDAKIKKTTRRPAVRRTISTPSRFKAGAKTSAVRTSKAVTKKTATKAKKKSVKKIVAKKPAPNKKPMRKAKTKKGAKKGK